MKNNEKRMTGRFLRTVPSLIFLSTESKKPHKS